MKNCAILGLNAQIPKQMQKNQNNPYFIRKFLFPTASKESAII